MNMLNQLAMLALLYGSQANAADNEFVVDVYRTQYTNENTLRQQFKNEFNIMAASLAAKNGMSSDVLAKYAGAKSKIEADLKKSNYYAYVNVSGILYHDEHKPYFTVDIVDKQDVDRLNHFRNPPSMKFNGIGQLMEPMTAYLKIINDSILQKHIFLSSKTCPVWHCTSGFEDSQLVKFLPIFNQIAQNYEWKLVNILRNDVNANDRANAAFLLAHIKKPAELIDILYYSIRDSDHAVRNNVMRVMAATINKAHLYDTPIDDVLLATDFPAETDRNKALYVLSEITQGTRSKDQYVITHAGSTLIECLKSKQLNIHEFAYKILKSISGEKFAENDYTAWAEWIKRHQVVGNDKA